MGKYIIHGSYGNVRTFDVWTVKHRHSVTAEVSTTKLRITLAKHKALNTTNWGVDKKLGTPPPHKKTRNTMVSLGLLKVIGKSRKLKNHQLNKQKSLTKINYFDLFLIGPNFVPNSNLPETAGNCFDVPKKNALI